MTNQFQPIIVVTYSQRLAYDTTLTPMGQCFLQTDDGPATDPHGYYYYVAGGFLYGGNQAAAPLVLDGRGPNFLAASNLRIYNTNRFVDEFLLLGNDDGGVWLGYVNSIGNQFGMEIDPTNGQTVLTTGDGTVLGLWTRNAGTGARVRMMDLKKDTGNNDKINANLRFGNGNNSGYVPVHYRVDLTEAANVGSSETDALVIPLPIGFLVANNQGVDVIAWGIGAANANAKRARLAFGSGIIADTTSIAANGLGWRIHAKIYRTGLSAQKYWSESLHAQNIVAMSQGTLTEAEIANINVIVKLTGASSNDIFIKGTEIMAYF